MCNAEWEQQWWSHSGVNRKYAFITHRLKFIWINSFCFLFQSIRWILFFQKRMCGSFTWRNRWLINTFSRVSLLLIDVWWDLLLFSTRQTGIYGQPDRQCIATLPLLIFDKKCTFWFSHKLFNNCHCEKLTSFGWMNFNHKITQVNIIFVLFLPLLPQSKLRWWWYKGGRLGRLH